MLNKEQIIEAIRPIQDPDLGISLVDLGLIYDAHFQDDGSKIIVEMTLTSPACPVGPQLMSAIHSKLLGLPDVKDVEVKLVWTPQWDPLKMASDEAKDQLGIF